MVKSPSYLNLMIEPSIPPVTAQQVSSNMNTMKKPPNYAESAEADEHNITMVSAIGVDRMRECFQHGNYLMNPLRLTFPKLLTAHTCVFKFILLLVRKCFVKTRRQTFREILEKYTKEVETNIAFSLFNVPSLSEMKRDEELITTIKDARRTIIEANRTTSVANDLEAKTLKHKIREFTNTVDMAANQADTAKINEVLMATAALKKLIEDAKKPLESHRALSFASQSSGPEEDDEERADKNMRTWFKYPGFLRMYKAVKSIQQDIQEGIKERSPIAKINLVAKISNTYKYLSTYIKHPFTRQVMFVMMSRFYLTVKNIKDEEREDLKQVAQQMIRDPLSLLTDKTSCEVKEMVEWLLVGNVVLPPSTANYPTSRGCNFEAYEPRSVLMRVYSTQAEFSFLQLLSWQYFHGVLTKEIKGTWSKEKIARYANEFNGKLVSNYRFRLGVEAAESTIKSLADEGYLVGNCLRDWPNLIPLASKHSPLVLALIIHIHHNKKQNMLNRPKLPTHRGTYLNNLELLRYVHSPGVLEKITSIRDACIMCQLRLKKSYQAALAPLPESAFTLNPGFLIAAADFKGPYPCRLLKGPRTTGTWKHQNIYILVVVCLTTRAVCLELCEDQTSDSLAQAFTRVSCQYQVPKILYIDRGASNKSFVENAEVHSRTNEILNRELGVQYQLVPVGKHHSLGRVERRCRSVGDMLGTLNLEKNPQSFLQFSTTLLMIGEMINNTPIAATLGSRSEILQVLTPNYLLRRVKSRGIAKPIAVPRDVTALVKAGEEQWQNVVELYNNCILPEELKMNLWHQDKNIEVKIDDIVYFKKLESNFPHAHLGPWAVGRIIEVHASKDSKIRSATIEYCNTERGNVRKHSTVRDTNSIYPLRIMANNLDADLKTLREELMDVNKIELVEDIKRALVADLVPVTMVSTERDGPTCLKCVNSIEVIGRRAESCCTCHQLENCAKNITCSVVLENDNMRQLAAFKCHPDTRDKLFQTITRKLMSNTEQANIMASTLQMISDTLATRVELEIIQVETEETELKPEPAKLYFLLLVDHTEKRVEKITHHQADKVETSDKQITRAEECLIRIAKDVKELREELESRITHQDEPSGEQLKRTNLGIKEINLSLFGGEDVDHGCSEYCCCQSHCKLFHSHDENDEIL